MRSVEPQCENSDKCRMTGNVGTTRQVFGFLVCCYLLDIGVKAASVANVTVKPKGSIAELNVSDSRNIYLTAPAPPKGRQPVQSENTASATNGYYNTEPIAPPGQTYIRERSANIRARQARPGARRSDQFDDDAEYVKGARPRAQVPSTRQPGYKPFGGSQVESDAELIDEKSGVVKPAAQSQKIRVGYKPFGGGEVSEEDRGADKPQVSEEEEYKPVEEETHHEEAPEAEGDGHHGGSDHEEVQEESAPAEEEEGSHAEEGSGGAAEEYQAAPAEEADEGAPAHQEVHHEGSEGEEKSYDEETKPVAEEVEDVPHHVHSDGETSDKSGDYASAPLHGHGHHGHKNGKFVKGGAQKKVVEHHSSKGEKSKKAYKEGKAEDHGDHGKHDKEAYHAENSKKDGKKKSHLDEAHKYGQAEEGEKGQKAGEFDDKAKHKKGHSTKGFRKVFKKDEFQKDETFYDESDSGGHHHKNGKAHKHHEGKKGSKADKGHHDSALDEGHHSKHDEKGHGKKVAVKKGHKGSAAHASKHKHASKSSKDAEEHAHKEAAHQSKH